MWSIETIIDINNTACRFLREGKTIRDVYEFLGIKAGNINVSTTGIEPEEITKKPDEDLSYE